MLVQSNFSLATTKGSNSGFAPWSVGSESDPGSVGCVCGYLCRVTPQLGLCTSHGKAGQHGWEKKQQEPLLETQNERGELLEDS